MVSSAERALEDSAALGPARSSLPPPPPSIRGAGCSISIVELDFEHKTDSHGELSHIKSALDEGRFVWIDVDVENPDEARRYVAEMGIGAAASEEILSEAFSGEPGMQLSRYDHHIHLVMSDVRLSGDDFALSRVDIVFGEKVMLVLHRGPVPFLEGVRKDYHADFVRFAKSPSFLMFELWDHLTEHYVKVQKHLEKRLERLQAELSHDDADDSVFPKTSKLGSDLLHFRSVLLPARAVLTELATRRTHLISEATQPFLNNMVGTLERVLQDVVVDRDILSQAISLYMTVVGHKSNQAMGKLTAITMIFLPLTFLCGVYGMNFQGHFPEIHHEWGYVGFWVVALSIAIGVMAWLRRKKLL